MNVVELADNEVSLPAEIIAKDLGLEPVSVLDRMRSGQLTVVCEQGLDEDAGRLRLTFFHQDRRVRLVLDCEGRVIERSAARLRRRSRNHQRPAL